MPQYMVGCSCLVHAGVQYEDTVVVLEWSVLFLFGMHIIENILICSFSHISCRRCIHESRHVDRCVHGCAYILHQSDGDGRGKLHGWKNRGGEREW